MSIKLQKIIVVCVNILYNINSYMRTEVVEMYTRLNSVGLFGIDSYMVEVEADLAQGLPSFDVVGLPDAAVKESRDRVRAAVKNCGFEFPVGRVTVNLAPADIRKEGSMYDLPLLAAILKASGQLEADLSEAALIGELSLDGGVRPVNGLLAMTIKAKQHHIKHFFVPAQNAPEGAIVDGIEIYPVKTVEELVAHLKGKKALAPAVRSEAGEDFEEPMPDFSEVKGQMVAKKALEVAAAGGHNVLLIGPPGSGKSMLAKRLPSILPEMTFEESMETTKIHSIAGTLPPNLPLITRRPFRAPHHTVSSAGLSGGGAIPRPGEISLAHNGVLFLDELPEFNRNALEVLRQPLEDGLVTISRVAGTLTYPCSIMLVAAMNPCPCGFFGHPSKKCTCTPMGVSRYLGRISGPMLDRLDLHIEVPPVEFGTLHSAQREETSAQIRGRVDEARKIQHRRYRETGITCNARLTPALLRQFCPMTEQASKLLQSVFDRMGLSGRAYDRLLKVARTIADLEQSEFIEVQHIAQSVQFRSLDRKYWNG